MKLESGKSYKNGHGLIVKVFQREPGGLFHAEDQYYHGEIRYQYNEKGLLVYPKGGFNDDLFEEVDKPEPEVKEITIDGEDYLVLNGCRMNIDAARKYYQIDKYETFQWGEVIDRFTYNFDGVQFMVIKYHPYESANGGASLNRVGNKNKILYFNDYVAEMNVSLIYIILLILAKMHLGENQRALAAGMAKALNEKIE